MSWFAGGAGLFAVGRIRRIVTRTIGLILLGAFVYFAVSVVQVLAASRSSQQPSAVAKTTYIVVMGENTLDKPLSKDAKNRLDQAMSLYQAGRGKKVVIGVSNCSDCSPTSARSGKPAGLEASFLQKQNLPGADLIELKATDDDGLLSSVAVLIGKGSRSVIIVSDPLDGLRLRATAASHGLAPEMSPATPPGSGILGDAGTIGQQALAVAIGRVFGFSSTGWASS